MMHCASCREPFHGSPLICAACGAVQSSGVEAPDYFQVFGLERRLGVDVAALEREFHRLSRRLHPDRFARATAEEQQNSLRATALLNDAWRVLRDPVERVEYLLKIEGHAVGEEHAGKARSAERQPPADLLEEVFELNMQLEEIRMSRKTGETADASVLAELRTAGERFEAMLDELDQALTAESTKWDAGKGQARAGAAARMIELLDRRRYLWNLVREVREALGAAA